MNKKEEFAAHREMVRISHDIACVRFNDPTMHDMLYCGDPDCNYPKLWFGKCMGKYRDAYHSTLHKEVT